MLIVQMAKLMRMKRRGAVLSHHAGALRSVASGDRNIGAYALLRMLSNPRFFLIFAAAAVVHSARGEVVDLTFERDVRPILKRHCFHCHGEGEKLKGGVDLRLRRFMEKPSEEGAHPLVPGKPEESEMLTLVREGEMPAKGDKLKPAEIATLEKWIAQGAKTARPEPAEVPKFFITEEEREFWACQPIKLVSVPEIRGSKSEIRNPIDAFLLAKLGEKGLGFAPEESGIFAKLFRR